MSFDSGFAVTPTIDPLGFAFGDGTFGPEVEVRALDAIRQNLLDPECDGPESVYAIAMDIGMRTDYDTIVSRNLLYGAVVYATGQLGAEPVRSQGHVHAVSASCGMSTPEVYEIWSGRACIYMQERATDNPGQCFAVFAEPGDIVIVPPGWAHATISADVDAHLSFGAWCVRDYGFDYSDVRAHQGLAWYPLVNADGGLDWQMNRHYELDSQLIIKSPRHYQEFGIEAGAPIYQQFLDNNERFDFVARPEVAMREWREFTP